jgi:hypothetical protein
MEVRSGSGGGLVESGGGESVCIALVPRAIDIVDEYQSTRLPSPTERFEKTSRSPCVGIEM